MPALAREAADRMAAVLLTPVAPIATKTAPAGRTDDLGIDISAGQEGWS